MDSDTLLIAQVDTLQHHQQTWDRCLALIREQVSTLSFKTWFQPIVPLKLEGRDLTIQVPSQFFYDWVEEHYNTLIRNTIVQILGQSARLYYSVASEERQEELFPVEEKPTLSPSPVQHAPFSPHILMRAEHLPQAQSNLNPRYTFENFIKGDSNQLARAAAMAVANNPGGTSFNPLVIYGGTGLGKTTLCTPWRIIRSQPEKQNEWSMHQARSSQLISSRQFKPTK